MDCQHCRKLHELHVSFVLVGRRSSRLNCAPPSVASCLQGSVPSFSLDTSVDAAPDHPRALLLLQHVVAVRAAASLDEPTWQKLGSSDPKQVESTAWGLAAAAMGAMLNSDDAREVLHAAWLLRSFAAQRGSGWALFNGAVRGAAPLLARLRGLAAGDPPVHAGGPYGAATAAHAAQAAAYLVVRHPVYDAKNRNWVTDDTLAGLAGLAGLQNLDLSDCRSLSDAGLAHVASLSNLRRLELGRCRSLTDAAAPHLRGLVKLQHLDLNQCNAIGDGALASIGGMTALTFLDCTGAGRITDAGKGSKQENCMFFIDNAHSFLKEGYIMAQVRSLGFVLRP